MLEWAAHYTGPLASIGPVVAGYAYPAPGAYATEAIAVQSHHDYPAHDIGLPVGTPLFAMVDGRVTTAIGDAGIFPASGGRCGNTVIISGTDGATYTYCHLSTVTVAVGDDVTAGRQSPGLSNAVTRAFVVAGAGFEPATFGL